jgi:hypothetical protein
MLRTDFLDYSRPAMSFCHTSGDHEYVYELLLTRGQSKVTVIVDSEIKIDHVGVMCAYLFGSPVYSPWYKLFCESGYVLRSMEEMVRIKE